MATKLSVVVPCYNEENRFQKGLTHYLSYLSKQKYPWELILVNDGSHDQTVELMRDSARGKSNIQIVPYSRNHGKGYAIIQGVKTAHGRYILFTDLDHSVPIDTIESFFKYFEKGYQAVIGSRRVKGAKILINQHFLRELLGKGFTLLVRLLIDWQIKDATCGFNAEILFICKKLKIQLAQAPVVWSDVRGTKVSLGKDVLRSLFGLVKIRLNGLQGKYSS